MMQESKKFRSETSQKTGFLFIMIRTLARELEEHIEKEIESVVFDFFSFPVGLS